VICNLDPRTLYFTFLTYDNELVREVKVTEEYTPTDIDDAMEKFKSDIIAVVAELRDPPCKMIQ
jgi:hypothetical protein